MQKIFICHAGADIDTEEGRADPLGIVGMAYIWDGEWVQSPEDVVNRDRSPAMKLRPLFGPRVEIYGDTSCFSTIVNCETYAEAD